MRFTLGRSGQILGRFPFRPKASAKVVKYFDPEASKKDDVTQMRFWANGQTFAKIATLSHASRRGVWFHVLCDVLRKHNRDRDGDSLSDKGMICYYEDRAWLFFLLVIVRIIDAFHK